LPRGLNLYTFTYIHTHIHTEQFKHTRVHRMTFTLFFYWREEKITMKYSFNKSMLVPLPHILKKFRYDSSNWGEGLYLPKHHKPWSLRDLQTYYFYKSNDYKVPYVTMEIFNLNCIDYMLRTKYKPTFIINIKDRNHPGMLCQCFKILKSKNPEFQTVIVKYDYPKDRIIDRFAENFTW
jgi:hypothetical protein